VRLDNSWRRRRPQDLLELPGQEYRYEKSLLRTVRQASQSFLSRFLHFLHSVVQSNFSASRRIKFHLHDPMKQRIRHRRRGNIGFGALYGPIHLNSTTQGRGRPNCERTRVRKGLFRGLPGNLLPKLHFVHVQVLNDYLESFRDTIYSSPDLDS
jgi:hypothetical protein